MKRPGLGRGLDVLLPQTEEILQTVVRDIEKVFIVGESGIGKSTFLQLLLGVLQPTSGSVTWVLCDGTRIDLRTIGYGLFSYVQQDKLLF